MKLISRIALVTLLSACSPSKDLRVEYTYPKTKYEQDAEKFGTITKEPIYLYRDKQQSK
jgi:hypothetical protein